MTSIISPIAPTVDRSACDAPIWPRQSGLELAPLGTAPSCARGHVRAMLAEWGLSDLATDAQTLVSELATNAVNAARAAGDSRPITVRLLADDQQVLIEVWDHSPEDPRPTRASHDAESGRGLMLVEDYSNRWGFSRTAYDAKVVWAELLINGKVRC